MVDFLYCGKTFSNENGLKKSRSLWSI
jgi:hypothetical protein